METRRFKLTWGEWCIVIGIVGLLIATVRPGVSQAYGERRLTDLVGRLHEVRAAIALYKADHAGLYPGQRHLGGNVDAAAFVADLTTPELSGQAAYLSTMPANPFITDPGDALRIVVANDPVAMPAATVNAGWWFNAATGRFCALDSEFHAEY